MDMLGLRVVAVIIQMCNELRQAAHLGASHHYKGLLENLALN